MTRGRNSLKPAETFEPLRRSLYIGRQHLGRFVQTGKKAFDAFDARGRRLGAFRSAAATLKAIRGAAPACEARFADRYSLTPLVRGVTQ